MNDKMTRLFGQQLVAYAIVHGDDAKYGAELRITALASMRNEGPFIVEWVCWYRMLGFTDIVVVTNNCTDHSAELLDALQEVGWVYHIRHDIPSGKHITRAKLKAARAHKSVRRATWLMICDVDEFLVIHRGNGKIGDLIDLTSENPPYLGMSINWKVFGTSGKTEFADQPIHLQFVYSHSEKDGSSRFVKSIFRMSKFFEVISEHSPWKFDFDRANICDSAECQWVNSAGTKIPGWLDRRRFHATIPRSLVNHEIAQINHYMLRSEETFSLKRDTKSPVALNDRYGEKYFLSANSGDELDASAFRYSAEFEAIFKNAMSLPNVEYFHALSCADHIKSIVEKNGGKIESDPRYEFYIEKARSLAASNTRAS